MVPRSASSWLKRFCRGLLGVFALLLTWGFLIEPHLYSVRREAAVLPALPEVWEGRRIAIIADLQIGMWGANTGTIRRIVERIIAERPAALLIAGDFVYHADGQIEETTSAAAALIAPVASAGIPTFAVLGNHDYSIDSQGGSRNPLVAAALSKSLEGVGIEVLENEAVRLTIRGSALYLLGIADEWAGLADVGAALSDVAPDEARIAFMHHPRTFGDFPPRTAPLAVAAHTHGGQITFPFTPEWSWMTIVRDQPVFADGWIDDFGEAGNRLYVNIGIGFSDLPIRINAIPELTIFTLVNGRE